MARIESIAVRNWPKEMRGAMAAMTPPDATYSVARDEDRPKPMNMLGVMANHPSLAKAFFTFNGYLLMATTLTERHRELLALRTGARQDCNYVWAHHVPMARDAGLADDEIDQIALGAEGSCWNELEAAMLRAADELIDDGVIAESTWGLLARDLDERQILDLIYTVGAYNVFSWMLRSVEVPLEEEFGIASTD
jgi:alkylhydroperoxidase family enzyme